MTREPDPVAGLLRASGPRALAPADRARRVEAAVRAEWKVAVKNRADGRRAGWIAASCLASAALIALVLHGHLAPSEPEKAASRYSPPPAGRVVDSPRHHGSYFRVNNEDRPPDRGVPRHVLASYSEPAR